MRKVERMFIVWIMGLVMLFGFAVLAAPPDTLAAPNTSNTQKTEKQCKTDRTTCEKNCDQLIDVGNNVQRCKDLCTDDYLMCIPLRSGQPGSNFNGVRPSVHPDRNAPIMRRGIEGEAGSSQSESSSEANK